VSTTSRSDEAGDAVLAEPARQRLVTIAADVVGRLAIDEVPASLRTIAKFTPARRARLGATALAAALDADEAFRAKVADVVAEASPQLVEAVRERTSTVASDPIDTAVVAYLLRPDGWTEVLAEANARWAAGRGRDAASSDGTARLRKENAELRARVKAESARIREAVATAAADATAELADLRGQLRARTGELRASERARDDAQRAVDDLQRRIEASESARDSELRRVRARIVELERAAESAKRGARTERDIDDARLWLLVDTLAEAAAGIRRELSLKAPAVRPADAVASAPSAAITRRADDPAVVDRLIALPNVHVIVDGYNVTKTGYGELSLADQRTRLIGSLAALAGRSGSETTIVFDGGTKPPAQPPTPRGVRVLFSAADEIADDLIRRLVAAEPEGRPLVVVTSDQEVVTDALRAGAWTVPSAVLLALLA
jgi:hypothetical protein